MKIWVCFVILLIAANFSPAARHRPVVPVKKKAATITTRKIVKSRRTPARKSSVHGRMTRATTPSPPPVPSSNDRFREIQEALASRGYLNTPPNGLWDQNSQDALRKFQIDQNLSVTGKLSSRSLIALGLGSPAATTPPPGQKQ